MRLSVVTAVDDHVPDPAGWFEALLGQSADPAGFEVIATDVHQMGSWQRAFDSLPREGHQQPRVVYRQLADGGRAHALNEALDDAAGDVVVFLADDFVPGPDFIEQHRSFHEQHPEREAVGVGKALVPPRAQRGPFVRWLERTGQFFGVPLDEESQSVPDYFFYVGNASVKRPLIEVAGRFDEDYPYHCWDDYEYGLRLRKNGMRSALIPDATVVHDHAITLRERRRQMYEAGWSAAIHERKDPGDHPWLGPGSVPIWRWRVAAWKWRLTHLVTRDECYRGLHYDRILNCAYAKGLRDGRREGAG